MKRFYWIFVVWSCNFFQICVYVFIHFSDQSEKVENIKVSVEKAKEAVQCDVKDGMSWCRSLLIIFLHLCVECWYQNAFLIMLSTCDKSSKTFLPSSPLFCPKLGPKKLQNHSFISWDCWGTHFYWQMFWRNYL